MKKQLKFKNEDDYDDFLKSVDSWLWPIIIENTKRIKNIYVLTLNQDILNYL